MYPVTSILFTYSKTTIEMLRYNLVFGLIGALISTTSVVQAQGHIEARTPVSSTSKVNFFARHIGKGGKSCYEQFTEAKQKGKESYGCIWRRLKLGESQEADAFFGGTRAGGVPTLRFGSEQTQVYSDLLSDNLYLTQRLGFVRVGFATVVSAGAADSNRTVDQFFQGGGNAILYFAMPQVVWVNYAVDTSSVPVRQVQTFWTAAIASDVPKIGSSNAEPSASVRVGHQIDGTWRTHNGRFGFFANARGNYVLGTAAFNRNLVGSEGTIPSWGMFALDYTVGVDLASLIRIGVGGGQSTAQGVRSNLRLAVELLRQQ
jgi:hypothetical protein